MPTPALAPALGLGILLVAGWRAIFMTFVAIAMIGAVWFALRQPETLPRRGRIPFTPRGAGVCHSPARAVESLAPKRTHREVGEHRRGSPRSSQFSPDSHD